jgi:hypothetical protein
MSRSDARVLFSFVISYASRFLAFRVSLIYFLGEGGVLFTVVAVYFIPSWNVLQFGDHYFLKKDVLAFCGVRLHIEKCLLLHKAQTRFTR